MGIFESGTQRNAGRNSGSSLFLDILVTCTSRLTSKLHVQTVSSFLSKWIWALCFSLPSLNCLNTLHLSWDAQLILVGIVLHLTLFLTPSFCKTVKNFGVQNAMCSSIYSGLLKWKLSNWVYFKCRKVVPNRICFCFLIFQTRLSPHACQSIFDFAVLVSLGCHKKMPWTGWITKTNTYFLIIVEAGGARSGGQL